MAIHASQITYRGRLAPSPTGHLHLGHARTSLEYSSLEDILERLPAKMEIVQRACSAASDATRARYFPSGAPTVWVGEAL